MYGSVARLRVKEGALEKFESQIEERKPDGFMGTYVYRSEKDPNELWMVAIFRDRESYFKNANSSEQNEEFLTWRKLMSAEPEWHDGEIVFHASGDDSE